MPDPSPLNHPFVLGVLRGVAVFCLLAGLGLIYASLFRGVRHLTVELAPPLLLASIAAGLLEIGGRR